MFLSWCFTFPGEDSVPAGVLLHTDGTAVALADEPHLVLEDLQGDGENSLQNEAECECKNGLAVATEILLVPFFLF